MGDTIHLRVKRYDGSGYDYKDVETREEANYWKKQYGAVEAPPEQNAGEFLNQATKSVQPSTLYEGAKQLVTDLPGTALRLGQVPVTLAGEAVDEFRQGNYVNAGRKALEAATPIATGVRGAAMGAPGGIPGMVVGGLTGFATGAGMASGADTGGEYLKQGLPYSAAGATVDAGLQAMFGARDMQPRTAPNPAAMAQAIDKRVANTTARTFGPTVGPKRYAWGNEARRLGPDILKKTTGGSVEEIGQQIHDFKERANVGLDSAYSQRPPVAGAPSGPAGVARTRMSTADVRQALQDRIDGLSSRWRNGNWEPYEGNATVVKQLQRAQKELDRLPQMLDPEQIRSLRQSWDKLAEFENVKESTVGWQRLQPQGEAFRMARDILNDKTIGTYPHLAPHIADAAFGIQADKLFTVLQETENARSRVGRRSIATVGGAILGDQFGAVGSGIGAMLAPALEYFVTERAVPAAKIKAARLMTNLADELRSNGQSAKAMAYAQEIRKLAQPVGPTIRAAEAEQRRPAPEAPSMEAAAASGQSPTSWFNTVLQKSGGQ